MSVLEKVRELAWLFNTNGGKEAKDLFGMNGACSAEPGNMQACNGR